jgi:phenylalanyl-tRNA synthetase beta chain
VCRVTAPSFRFDIGLEEDLIEELGRMLGYDSIPILPGAGRASLGVATEWRVGEERGADALVARGDDEVITSGVAVPNRTAAVNPEAELATLVNPISSDLAVMRRSLWPGLLTVAQQNLSRQQTRLRLFEIGHQFNKGANEVKEIKVLAGLAAGTRWPEHWDLGAGENVDFYDIKADLEALLATTGRAGVLKFEAAEHPALKPGQSARISFEDGSIGWLGCVHPKVQRVYDLKVAPVVFALDIAAAFSARVPTYRSYSKFPSVRRDLAVVVGENVHVDRLLDCIKRTASETLQSVTVFDVYRGKGIESMRKSVGLGLILQDASRTLTDQDADETVQFVIQRLEHELGATIRT